MVTGFQEIYLKPLFERVFMVERRPKSEDGTHIQLKSGMFILHNIDKHLWRLGGVNISTKGDIIYRASSSTIPTDIFIVAPAQWSKEGSQFSINHN